MDHRADVSLSEERECCEGLFFPAYLPISLSGIRLRGNA